MSKETYINIKDFIEYSAKVAKLAFDEKDIPLQLLCISQNLGLAVLLLSEITYGEEQEDTTLLQNFFKTTGDVK